MAGPCCLRKELRYTNAEYTIAIAATPSSARRANSIPVATWPSPSRWCTFCNGVAIEVRKGWQFDFRNGLGYPATRK